MYNTELKDGGGVQVVTSTASYSQKKKGFFQPTN